MVVAVEPTPIRLPDMKRSDKPASATVAATTDITNAEKVDDSKDNSTDLDANDDAKDESIDGTTTATTTASWHRNPQARRVVDNRSSPI